MDPTAQNNNSQGAQNASHDSPQPQSVIQPGQFVVAGEETQIPPQPTSSQPQTPTPQEPQQPPAPMQGFSLAGQSPSINTEPLVQDSTTPRSVPQQPDPTLFTPPSSDVSAGASQPPSQTPPPSKIKMLRTVFIATLLIVLIGAIAAVAWFFILSPQNKEPVQTENEETLIEAPSPTTQQPESGFGELPQSTSEAPPLVEELPASPPQAP